MSKPKTEEELGEELCNYCELDHEARGVHFSPGSGGPIFCSESPYCEKAYEAYLDDFEEDEDE